MPVVVGNQLDLGAALARDQPGRCDRPTSWTRRRWRTRAELEYAIVYWTERTYNRRRRGLGKLSPAEFQVSYPSYLAKSRSEYRCQAARSCARRLLCAPNGLQDFRDIRLVASTVEHVGTLEWATEDAHSCSTTHHPR